MSLLDNLVSYWKMDEESGVRVDSHGTNDLADINTVLFGVGVKGNAADFELNNTEYLRRADPADLSFGDEPFTIAGWAKFESQTENAGIVTKYAYSDNDREYILYYSQGTDRFAFGVSPDGIASTHREAVTFGALALATWYFVVGWHDPVANVIGIAVNGGAADTVAHATGCNDNVSWFAIGMVCNSAAPGTVQKMDGLIDEVGAWGKVLTAGERTWLYNGGAGRTYEDFLVGQPTMVRTQGIPTGPGSRDRPRRLFMLGGNYGRRTRKEERILSPCLPNL